jgi:hypothetical protein
VRVLKEVELESRDDIPKLLYGLDLVAGTPVRVTIEVGASESRLKLVSWLPDEYLRLLRALATDISSVPDKLPRLFQFENRWREDIEGVLRDLGVELQSESSTRN